MENRNNHHRLASSCDPQSHTIQPQRNQDKNLPEIVPKTTNQQQQQPPIVQWPYTSQSATEQFMAVSMASQAQSPGSLNQWPPPPQPPFWHPQWPAGAVPFIGGTSSTTQTPVPNMCYPAGYTFPGFQGPCDPSSMLGQMQQLQHPYYVYYFPGPAMSGCSASGEQSSERGIIRPTTNLLQEHQRLWEAQSSENARLRSVISKLEAEVSDYKNRVAKLEEASSLQRKVEAPPVEVTGIMVPFETGQPRKRGRPRKSLANSADAAFHVTPRKRGRPKKSLANSVDALQVSLPQLQAIKPAPSKHPFEIKSPVFEKVVLQKVDNKDIPTRSSATMVRQQTNEKISNSNVTDVSGSNNLTNKRKAMLSGETVYFDTIEDMMNASYGLQRDVTMKGGSISARISGFNWNHGGACQKSARELLDAAHQGLFRSGNVIQQEEQGARVTPGRNVANEEDSSEELGEDTNLGSAEEDENEEEMGEDTSSSA